MTTSKIRIVLLFTLVFPFTISAQVKDLGDQFLKKVFIQYIDFSANLMQTNSLEDGQIIEEIMKLNDVQVFNSDKVSVPLESLKIGMEIEVAGDLFKVDQYNEARKITILDDNYKDKPSRTYTEARIDYIKVPYAYVDGHRVKLNPSKKITGRSGTKKRAGYENRTYDGVGDIKEGDFAKIGGKYNLDNYYAAEEFEIAPEDETKADKAAKTVDEDFHKLVYDTWVDKSKRSKFFNKEVKGKGKINSNAELQEYVQQIGLKLVPNYVKERGKIKFIFIVIDNVALNADIRANGLAFINTGLLKSLENEAQLAAILSHEIAHAMYEHVAKEMRKRNLTAQQKDGATKVGSAIKSILPGKLKSDDAAKSNAKKQTVEETTNNVTDFSNLIFDVRLSDYSVDQEIQADRVGLSLMAFANYDTTQAARVWKNIYMNYNVFDDNAEGQKLAKAALIEGINDIKTEKSKASAAYVLKSANFLLKTQSKDYKTKSFRTHPDEIKRFRNLNHLVAMYWADPSYLNSSIVNDKIYTTKTASLRTAPKK